MQLAKRATPQHFGEGMPRKTILFLISFILAVASACQTSPSPLSTTDITPTTLTASPTIAPALTTSTPYFSTYLTRVAQQDRDRINELLTTNAGCVLPCWWGITPGLTTLTEADRLMRELGAFGSVLKAQQWRLPDGSVTHEVGFDLVDPRESISIQFGVQNNIIQSLLIKVYEVGEPLDFRYWDTYSLTHIFEKYGKPDRIWLKNTPFVIEPPASDITLYGLFVFYDDLKILIVYPGITKIEDPMLICPNLEERQIDGMELYLVNASQEVALEEYAGFILDRQEYMLPIEEASGLSVPKFYEFFLSGNRCFETPRKIWH